MDISRSAAYLGRDRPFFIKPTNTSEDIDKNLKTLTADLTCTNEDRMLPADFWAKAYNSDVIKGLKIS